MPGAANRHGNANPTGLTAGWEPSSLAHDDVVAIVTEHFPRVAHEVAHGELTIYADADDLVGLVRLARDDERLRCRHLSDLSGVHWPAGEQVIDRQPSTTGWPEYRVERETGAIEVNYVLRSVEHNHHFRVAVATDDVEPRLPSLTGLYPGANWHEREVHDMFGVEFVGHPDLTRILMPDDWLGHPHRKDYPLGGVDVEYKNDKHIPPPHERALREVVGEVRPVAAAPAGTSPGAEEQEDGS